MNKDELVAKADLALSDLAKNGGKMTPAQSDKFAYELMRGWEFELLAKIKHHLDRALMWEKQRRYGYARGARAKAIKKIERLSRFLEGKQGIDFVVTSMIADTMSDDMEEMILYGDPIPAETQVGIMADALERGPAKLSFGARILRSAMSMSKAAAKVKKEIGLPDNPDAGHTSEQLRIILGLDDDEVLGECEEAGGGIQTCLGKWVHASDDLWYFIKDNPHED